MKGAVHFPAVAALAALTIFANDINPRLEVAGWESNGWPRLAIFRPTNLLYTIQSSKTLMNWAEIAVLHGREFTTNPPVLSFIDMSGAQSEHTRFYRAQAAPITFADDWRNQIFFPNDHYLSESLSFGLPETRWIKFAILTNEPNRVYFQNSLKYKFHYNFASARLPGFKGMSPAQFDDVSLHTNAQRAVLGTVLFSPFPEEREAAIQFVGYDPYRPEEIARWFEIVRSTIQPLNELNVLYIPTYEQAAIAEQNRALFSARGIQIGSLTKWDTGANAYSTGWAIGRLRYVPASEIEEAYSNGTLKPADILLTDAVPAELPYVAGVLSLAPSTPNSHVAILARSYGVPFVYLAEPELRAQAQAYTNREIALTAFPGYPQVTIRLLDLTGTDPAIKEQLVAAKNPEPLNIAPRERFGAYTASTENLVPGDIRFFGGKAANFGFLRRQIPTNSPPAIAISFDLWDDFMSQTNGTGKTLRQQIAERLNKYTYPPNIRAFDDELEAIRDLIEDTTAFTTEQQEQIAAALLAKFDPQMRIRFRSSTNVEDAENFTGAGLYDSYSGCLADDQDSDTAGPSLCDPAENNERGVFRAIRKVYASFYNLNAVLERMRNNIDETKVGMAILVHYSSPDEFELANGVATVTYTESGGSHSYEGKMVTQKGAVSVTNPDGSALPEVVSFSKTSGNPYFSVKEYSSLLPRGATVLTFDSEYEDFASLFAKAAVAFNGHYTNKTHFTLDFEYKKLAPGALHVKQVRELPSANPNATTTTYLLNQPQDWRVFQGDYGTVFGNHRLKSKLHLATLDLKLTTNAIAQTIYGPISMEYLDGGAFKTLTGVPNTFSNAAHKVGPYDPLGTPLTDSWTLGTSNGSVRLTLTTTMRTTARPAESPVISLADAQLQLAAAYSRALPIVETGRETNSVTEDFILLTNRQETNSKSIEITRTVPATAGAAVTTTFYWPEPPKGVTAGYTAPLMAWKQTRIEGLTTEPIILRDYYSQTYRPHHHNFSEDFLFEPALEPGISSTIVEELRARNIRYIYVFWGGEDFGSTIWVAGEDGSFRPLLNKSQRSAER
jgi:hypothetical protein